MFPYKPYRSSLHALPKRRRIRTRISYLFVTLLIFYQQVRKYVNCGFCFFETNLLFYEKFVCPFYNLKKISQN